jgi:hypothetical protein
MEDFLVPGYLDPDTRDQALRMIARLDVLKQDKPQKDFDILLCEPGIGLPRNGYLFDPCLTDEELIDAIVAENQSIELALARAFPIFRQAVSHRIIARVSRENAMLALMTALPNVLPSFIELPWAVGEFATDTAFLTMNQIRMALMMAAIYEQPVGGLTPKAAIAYAGTWVVGTGLDKLYRTGAGHSRHERREAWALALTRGKEVAGEFHN